MQTQPKHATASFDLFDTLLIRPVLHPHDVFRLVERDLAAPGWARARIAAERIARAAKASRETDLDEIYAAAPLARWSSSADTFRRRELHWETQTSIDPEAAVMVRQARDEGARVLFITDMYLPRNTLLELLAPVWQEGDTLLISHEEGLSKAEGLWAKIAKLYPHPWIHTGDNPHADIVQAAKHGIQTRLWTRSLPTQAELALASDNRSDPLAAGLSRFARLTAPANSHPIWADGANISGPVFFGFSQWILEQAAALGVDHVYFLSRDGQLPEKIAAEIKHWRPDLPPSSYLHGSRHSWYLALFDLSEPTHWTWFNHPPDPTISGLIDLLEADHHKLETCIIAAGYPESMWRVRMSLGQRLGFWSNLAAIPAAVDYFTCLRRKRLQAATDYLKHQGVFQHAHVAIVDIGWSGTMHHAFGQLVAQGSTRPIRVSGFFFGLHNRPKPDRHVYHISSRYWPHWANAFPSVIEMLVPGDHGQTMRYAHGPDGVAIPLLADDKVAPPESLDAVHHGALSYVKLALRYQSPPPRFERCLREFVIHPTSEQISRWSRFRFCTWQKPAPSETTSLIPAFSKRELVFMIATLSRNVGKWPWATASLAVSLPRVHPTFQRLLAAKFQIDWLINRSYRIVVHRISQFRRFTSGKSRP